MKNSNEQKEPFSALHSNQMKATNDFLFRSLLMPFSIYVTWISYNFKCSGGLKMITQKKMWRETSYAMKFCKHDAFVGSKNSASYLGKTEGKTNRIRTFFLSLQHFRDLERHFHRDESPLALCCFEYLFVKCNSLQFVHFCIVWKGKRSRQHQQQKMQK